MCGLAAAWRVRSGLGVPAGGGEAGPVGRGGAAGEVCEGWGLKGWNSRRVSDKRRSVSSLFGRAGPAVPRLVGRVW